MNVDAFGQSWVTDFGISFTDTDGDPAGPFGYLYWQGNNDPASGYRTFASGGVVDLASANISYPLLENGQIELQFYERYDDIADTIDAQYASGSKLIFEYILASESPSAIPSLMPSAAPSLAPSTAPSPSPSLSSHPSLQPSATPSISLNPSDAPSSIPSSSPSSVPSMDPSSAPSLRPSSAPSLRPSSAPSLAFG